jgi:GT2 family glycosyltransferase
MQSTATSDSTCGASGLPKISIVIPTYGRERVLLDSISALLVLEYPANEILVVDQSRKHGLSVMKRLESWNAEKKIRWIRRKTPSITESMNHGLKSAQYSLVLFLDDDIKPRRELVRKHVMAHSEDVDLWATVGQVIQPWQAPEELEPCRVLKGLRTDFDFPFNSTLDAEVQNVMAGNLCVNREHALSIGGFDENFIGPAYRFETDFARRVVNSGGKIRFIGSAGIDHLRAESGGTRSSGSHLTSASPLHGFGDYYYAFKHGEPKEAWIYSMNRFLREVRTRFHLTHPWWIPVKWIGEIRALFLARSKVKEAA